MCWENQLRKSSVKSRRRKWSQDQEKPLISGGKFMRQPAVRFERIFRVPLNAYGSSLLRPKRSRMVRHGVIEPPRSALTLLEWPYSRSCHTVETTRLP